MQRDWRTLSPSLWIKKQFIPPASSPVHPPPHQSHRVVPRHLLQTLVLFTPKIRTHIPGCLPLFSSSLSPPLLSLPSPQSTPTIPVLLPLNRPVCTPRWSFFLRVTRPSRPQPFPLGDPRGQPLQPGTRTLGARARTPSPFPSSAHPPLPSGPRRAAVPGRSRERPSTLPGGRRWTGGGGVGIGRREQGEGRRWAQDRRRPLSRSCAAHRADRPLRSPGSRLRGGRSQTTEIVEESIIPSALLLEAACGREA